MLKSVNEHFKRPRPPDDRYDIFGKNVANVLRDVLAPQRILAEKFINDVLFHAQMGTLTTSHVLTQVPQLPLPQHYAGPPTVQSASPNSTAVPYFAAGNSYYNRNPTKMPQQEGRQPQKPPVYHQLNQCTGAPNELSPLNDSTEGITVSHFVSTFRPEDGQ